MTEYAAEEDRQTLAQIGATYWQLVNPLLDELLEADPSKRDAMLQQLRGTNPGLAEDLASLLAQQPVLESQQFLTGSVSDFIGGVAGMVIGNYTLDRPLGEGGMGTVWLAHRSDGRFEGQAAIKFLNLKALLRDGAAKFRQEGSLLARLAHPNIARLLDAGVSNQDQPYLLIEFVDGEPIDRWCDAHELDVDQRLRLFQNVLAAVAHAHSNLILHRDLKPSNIFVTRDGQVKLLDFGIAQLLDDQPSATQVSQTAQSMTAPSATHPFTLGYAAPEQVQGGAITMATDVYALGVLLYVLLSGTHPTEFEGATKVEALSAIVNTTPSRLSDAARRGADKLGAARRELQTLRGELDSIVAKALSKNPGDRYHSAEAFADDIARYFNGLPVLAHPDRLFYRARKFARRHSLVLSAAAAIVLSLVIGTMVAVRQAQVAQVEARKARAVQDFLADVFLANSYDQPDPLKAQNATARELLMNGAQRVKSSLADAPDAKAEVLRTLGGLVQGIGLPDQAAELQRERVELLRTLHGEDLSVADALLALSDSLFTAANKSDHESVLTEAKRIIDADKSANPSMRAELLFQLAELDEYRNWPRARDYAGQATALFKRYGPQARAAESLTREGIAYNELHDPVAAERAFIDGLGIARQLTRDRNRLMPAIQLELADVQSELMKIDAADANYREAIATAERIYGRDHDQYTDVIYNYGSFLGQNSRSTEALPFLREAVETNRRTKGADEVFFGPKFQSLLGAVLVEHGRPEEAVPLYAHAMQLRRNAGRDNLSLAAFLILAARAPMDCGDRQQALAYLDEARSIVAAHDAVSGQDIARKIQIEQARFELRFNRPAEAQKLLSSALGDIAQPPTSRPELMARVLLAETQIHSGDSAAAAQTSATAREVIRRLGLERAAAREMARLDVIDGIVLLSQADTAGAIVLFQRALDTRRALLDPHSPLIAEAQMDLARAYRLDRNPQQAELALRDARNVMATHPRIAPQYAIAKF